MDPFEPSEELASLSSGCVATETNKLDRLLSDSVGFFEPLSKLKLGTFRDVQRKSQPHYGHKATKQ